MRIVGYVTGAVEKIVSAATWKVISATKTTASWIEVTWWQQSHPILIGAASCAVLGAALYRYPVRDVIIPVGTAASLGIAWTIVFGDRVNVALVMALATAIFAVGVLIGPI